MQETTGGIVLRKVVYGETSLIVSAFTKRFGLQSYLIKGVRGGKGRNKANLFFPSSLLEMTVYHNEQKSLQWIREYHAAPPYCYLGEDVVKTSVAVFAAEVLSQLLEPGAVQEDLYHFAEAFFLDLDTAARADVANYPLFFLIRSCRLAGYYIAEHYAPDKPYLKLDEGRFVQAEPQLPHFWAGEEAELMGRLNDIQTLEEIKTVRLQSSLRSRLMENFQQFFEYHIPGFKPLRSVPVLSAILR